MRRWALREIRQSDSVLNMCVSKKDKNTFEHEPKKKYLVSTFIRILPAACAGCSVAIRIQLHNPDSRWISAYQMLAGALQPLVLLMIISSGCCISAIAATMSGIFQVTTFDGIWRQTADIRLYLQPAWGKKKKSLNKLRLFTVRPETKSETCRFHCCCCYLRVGPKKLPITTLHCRLYLIGS